MPSPDDAVESGLLSNMSYQAMELIANMSILANFVFGQSQRNGSG
jgi:ABC-type sugar transport system ATPase subunit